MLSRLCPDLAKTKTSKTSKNLVERLYQKNDDSGPLNFFQLPTKKKTAPLQTGPESDAEFMKQYLMKYTWATPVDHALYDDQSDSSF